MADSNSAFAISVCIRCGSRQVWLFGSIAGVPLWYCDECGGLTLVGLATVSEAAELAEKKQVRQGPVDWDAELAELVAREGDG